VGDKYALWVTLKKIERILSQKERSQELSEIHEQISIIEREIEDKKTIPLVQANISSLMIQYGEHAGDIAIERQSYTGLQQLQPVNIQFPRDWFKRVKLRLIDLPDLDTRGDVGSK